MNNDIEDKSKKSLVTAMNIYEKNYKKLNLI